MDPFQLFLYHCADQPKFRSLLIVAAETDREAKAILSIYVDTHPHMAGDWRLRNILGKVGANVFVPPIFNPLP